MSKNLKFSSNPREKKPQPDLSALQRFVQNNEPPPAPAAPAPAREEARAETPPGEEGTAKAAPQKPVVKKKRLTLDLHPALHKRIKKKCVDMDVDMVEEITRILEIHFPEES
jgi:hypothetical protein